MAFTVTNNFSGQTTLDPDEIDQNFTDIEAKLNAGLTTSNLSASAGITNAQLTNSHYEILMKLSIHTPSDGSPPTGNELIDWHIMPDLVTDGTYTITDCEYYCSDIGTTGNITITIASGYVTAGAFSATTTHVSAQTIAGATNNEANGSLTIATAAIPASANNAVMRMSVTLADASMMSNLGDRLVVVLKLKRTNGLRS